MPDAAGAGQTGGAAFPIPEVTRGLRGLGSRRGSPGSDHDRFFAPLLTPLRRARDAADLAPPGWPRAAAFAAAFTPPLIGAEIRGVLAQLARERCPASAPDCRALEAELLELAEALFGALGALDTASATLRSAAEAPPPDGDAVRAAAWHAWSAALARTFAAADRCWLAALPPLCDSRGASGRLWRRVLRGPSTAWLAVALGAALGGPPALPAQPPAPSAQRPHDPRVIVRVTGGTPGDSLDARALARRGFDVIPGRAGEVLVVVDSADRARLDALGARTTVVRAPAAPLRRRDAAPRDSGAAQRTAATVVYRPYDHPRRGVRALLDSLARANPRVRLDTLGRSHEGRPILAVQLGQRDDSPSRPNVLFMATYHAREWAATEMALRLARHLAAPPAPSARLDSLLARRDVWVVPVANPDGYEFSFTADRLWRKNRRPAGSGAFDAAGVDLNRNHSAHWGADNEGSSPDPRSPVYRGPSPSSEPETQAIERFHAEHPPVLAVSYHAYAGMLLYPPGWRFGLLSGDHGIYQTLAGTDERPAVRDLLPGTLPHGYQRPAVAWQLYVTNGEYTDWASERFGTLAFTPELTSGFEGSTFYHFEFPDDEAKLQRLFEDNLPFALDVIESAADPLRYVSPTTGLATAPLALESVSPTVRVRLPAALAPSAVLRADGAPLRSGVDTLGGGRWMRRVVGELPAGAARPQGVSVVVPRDSARFRVLLAGGAEPADTGWAVSGFSLARGGITGTAEWRATRSATLLSPLVQVPADIDTVTVALWTRHSSFSAAPTPGVAVRVSRDGGRTLEPLLTIAGEGPEWYPDSRQVAGVRGRTLQLALQVTGTLFVALDEVTIVGHLPRPAGGPEVVAALRASENPIRGDAVSFNWPFGAAAGDLFVYDFSGRLVWRTAVEANAPDVSWPVAQHAALANGVYLAVARAGDAVRRQTVYVLRAAR